MKDYKSGLMGAGILAIGVIIGVSVFLMMGAATLEQTTPTYYQVQGHSSNQVGAGYGSDGITDDDDPLVVNHTGFIMYEWPVGAIQNSASGDEFLWYDMTGLATTSTVDLDGAYNNSPSADKAIEVDDGAVTLEIGNGAGPAFVVENLVQGDFLIIEDGLITIGFNPAAAVAEVLIIDGDVRMDGETNMGVDANDFVKIDGTDDGHMTFNGAATVWGDFLIPLTKTVVGGGPSPTFSVYQTDGGGSTGVNAHEFDNNVEMSMYFTIEMPPDWKEGTDIYPHTHFATPSNGASGQRIVWGLEYTWVDHTEIAGNTTLITTTTIDPADANYVLNKHYLGDFAAITGSGKLGSSALICRIYRDAGAFADDFPDNAWLFSIDFNYEIDEVGDNDRP